MIHGIGTDIIEIDRIQKAIDKWGTHFLNHVYTPNEIQYVEQHKNKAQHYAVRFAAKEAVYKAVSDNPKLSWQDIEILNDQNGKPYCVLKEKDYPYEILISLSHSKYYAVANAIITS